MQTLDGKVALVTGGGQGLGAEISRTLAEAGAVVVVADIREDTANQVVQEIQSKDGKAMLVRLDVTDEVQAEMALKEVLDKAGRLDILINNAGTDKTVS